MSGFQREHATLRLVVVGRRRRTVLRRAYDRNLPPARTLQPHVEHDLAGAFRGLGVRDGQPRRVVVVAHPERRAEDGQLGRVGRSTDRHRLVRFVQRVVLGHQRKRPCPACFIGWNHYRKARHRGEVDSRLRRAAADGDRHRGDIGSWSAVERGGDLHRRGTAPFRHRGRQHVQSYRCGGRQLRGRSFAGHPRSDALRLHWFVVGALRTVEDHPLGEFGVGADRHRKDLWRVPVLCRERNLRRGHTDVVFGHHRRHRHRPGRLRGQRYLVGPGLAGVQRQISRFDRYAPVVVVGYRPRQVLRVVCNTGCVVTQPAAVCGARPVVHRVVVTDTTSPCASCPVRRENVSEPHRSVVRARLPCHRPSPPPSPSARLGQGCHELQIGFRFFYRRPRRTAPARRSAPSPTVLSRSPPPRSRYPSSRSRCS